MLFDRFFFYELLVTNIIQTGQLLLGLSLGSIDGLPDRR
jgi:hypothetical protein